LSGTPAAATIRLMNVLDTDLGDGLRLRTLTLQDAPLVVEATRAETAPALWGPRPRGPYSADDAAAALRDAESMVSFGLITGGRLLGALGLMRDHEPGSAEPDSAELAYWVRPENRRQGLALRGIRAVTDWAHRAGLSRIWLEINPDNTASLRLAERAGYQFAERIAGHCRTWTVDDAEQDSWHDCLILTHIG
jgi:RimJ/RimL family protein N-acetyltransferase